MSGLFHMFQRCATHLVCRSHPNADFSKMHMPSSSKLSRGAGVFGVHTNEQAKKQRTETMLIGYHRLMTLPSVSCPSPSSSHRKYFNFIDHMSFQDILGCCIQVRGSVRTYCSLSNHPETRNNNGRNGAQKTDSPTQKIFGKSLDTSSDFSNYFRSYNTQKGTLFKGAASAEDSLEMFMLKRLSDLPGEPHKNQPVTIYRVPASLREKRKALYEPRMVSIGPYYHGREELQAMEEHKWWYLRDMISRKAEISLGIYLEEIRKLESQARQCYSESIKLSSDEFVQMLLLDGCFILEYLHKYEHKQPDVLSDVGWGGPMIISDLLLLENQIPFFIIYKLASILTDINNCQSCKYHCDLVQNLYSLLPYQEMLIPPKVSCKSIQHLLHLYYICLVPNSISKPLQHPTIKRTLSWLWMRVPQKATEDKMFHRTSVIIPCASELQNSGVKFRRNSSHHLFDITFKKGVLEMPLLVVDNTIRTIFTNIVAFEQTQISGSRIFTSYVVLWNMLVDTPRDVNLLENRGIVELVQHNEEQAANFFNELADCWSLDYEDHHYANLFLELQKYCSSTWHKSRGVLMQEYFNNPWRAASVVGGVTLLILTMIQTYCSLSC